MIVCKFIFIVLKRAKTYQPLDCSVQSYMFLLILFLNHETLNHSNYLYKYKQCYMPAWRLGNVLETCSMPRRCVTGHAMTYYVMT